MNSDGGFHFHLGMQEKEELKVFPSLKIKVLHSREMALY